MNHGSVDFIDGVDQRDGTITFRKSGIFLFALENHYYVGEIPTVSRSSFLEGFVEVQSCYMY